MVLIWEGRALKPAIRQWPSEALYGPLRAFSPRAPNDTNPGLKPRGGPYKASQTPRHKKARARRALMERAVCYLAAIRSALARRRSIRPARLAYWARLVLTSPARLLA